MAGFQCGICDRVHDHLPRDIAYRRPAPYFDVPKEERARRVYETDDLCVIDNRTFMIRGVLYLPVNDEGPPFGWGVWAQIGEADFRRYLDAWKQDTEDSVPLFKGRLAGNLRAYPGSDGLEVSVRLHSGGQRPTFQVVSDTDSLGTDQRDGITAEKAHSFVAQWA